MKSKLGIEFQAQMLGEKILNIKAVTQGDVDKCIEVGLEFMRKNKTYNLY